MCSYVLLRATDLFLDYYGGLGTRGGKMDPDIVNKGEHLLIRGTTCVLVVLGGMQEWRGVV